LEKATNFLKIFQLLEQIQYFVLFFSISNEHQVAGKLAQHCKVNSM